MIEQKKLGQTSDIDLLALPILPEKGVTSHRGRFEIRDVWALAEFGKLPIKPGWWRLDSEGGPDHAEIRLASDRDPLIVISTRTSARVHLASTDGYHLALLVSPWPGTYSFSVLKLRRLGSIEIMRMIVSATARMIRHPTPVQVLKRVVRRISARQALALGAPSSGMLVASSSQISTQKNRSTQRLDDRATRSAVRTSSIIVHANPGDRVHKNAEAIAQHAFDRNPKLKVVFSDVVEAGQLVPHTEWDTELNAFGTFKNAPLFTQSNTAISTLDEAVAEWGAASVARIPLPLIERDSVSTVKTVQFAVPSLAVLPSVSVIIPTKYRIDLLEKCIRGLIEKTGYPAVEIIVVDNGVTDPRFPRLLDQARASFPVKIVEDKGPFNFSRLVNAGVSKSGGEIILLLNDDIEPIEAGWLHRMVASVEQRDVGAVGAQLLYPDRSIQHAGVVLGLGGTCAHLWRGLSPEAAAQNPYVGSVGGRMAVTGACLAVKRSAFELVGGFDENEFPVAYNDIDFCLRLRDLGLRNIYRGDAILFHHESQSRGSDEATIATHKRQSDEAARFLQRWRNKLNSDPYFSPAFDPLVEIGAAHRANFAPSEDYVELSALG